MIVLGRSNIWSLAESRRRMNLSTSSSETSGDHFTALLGDTPEYIHNIKPDARVEFEKSDIFDWMYIENGKVKGNYTACPLLLAGPKEQLEQYREIYGIVCD
ncbi:hypothetical protein AMC87_CH01795 [Rhizobium phaseoli]|nr:hypothetical protein AMC87_CH01795 [Rhizobium phaseoli]